MEAIRECSKEVEDELREQFLSQTKAAVNLAYDVKKNNFLQLLTKFSTKYLRLKIVQNQKRSMPSASDMLNRDATGLGFDADQISMSGTSTFSESQLSSTSGSQQSSSGFSQTSKLSKRNPDRKQKKKMRKRRQVKEGSPFEEDNLIEILKEDIRCT